MLTNLSCQPDRIWTHLGDKPLGMAVRKFLDWVI